ncbi:cyclic nucleotide-regulated ABC bacteriocin/lantibiotic exporter (plasmid) [Gloeocapsa sp. PCC 7428]|uniref:peptidase domain-containing ABC transporter n=1 Tax=Gloeocapsa sp. PCC 7428 TaxID=1173026 RepID=UPI0002A5FB77|nr:peptidase domain-containing ABC transporter [Gloeocapsa sp. PCC 7428]AFZ33399.1 cyclic nucleotide-regulated ABC bacteriocin/lantibiotic exporter [Gloeocapsa sp. PCC 7428]
MIDTIANFDTVIAQIPPFDRLSSTSLEQLTRQAQIYRYRVGQAIAVREKMPAQVSVLCQGQVRLLGFDPNIQTMTTISRLSSGAIIGVAGLLRGIACETAIASTECTCLNIPSDTFLDLIASEPALNDWFKTTPTLIETFEVLAAWLQQAANPTLLQQQSVGSLTQLVTKVFPQVVVTSLDLNPRKSRGNQNQQLDNNLLWLVSNQNSLELPVGYVYDQQIIAKPTTLRLVGLPKTLLASDSEVEQTSEALSATAVHSIAYAPREIPEWDSSASEKRIKYPYVKGKGDINGALACFEMLAQYWGMPFRKDVVRRVLTNQKQRVGALSLLQCGGVTEMLGIQAQLIEIPEKAIARLQVPAMIQWRDSFALIYSISAKTVVMGVPEVGILRQRPAELFAGIQPDAQTQQRKLPVLMLQTTPQTPQRKFGLSWFLPSLFKYRRVLVEVFIASFFAQLFALVNPLTTQVIIDKVILQNSPDTLQVLGVFLIVIAVFEAILISLRTYLFADTTNRIDLALGSEIIDHLLRLPLRYFERRPVGELATRVNELENIRQFLTGTALTVVLDAVFSVIYIVVMLIYSWLLTLVALVTLPLFIGLTAFVSPIVRRQLREKAELNAAAQSHLVEVLSGIQTVKAQNLELRSRWKWQERYSRYISSSFKTVFTYTTATSTSTFLNHLSSLLVLWVGAYLVLQGELTLGQLIAFRIIAGYVTSPLLRLTQLWQNFQQTALSLERLSDIVDTPVEADSSDRGKISLPRIEGKVKYENLSFRFAPNGPLQLNNVNLEFSQGSFIGIVGQSGSGKSTLMKLLSRLYDPESGRILIDNYDIHKVELYSLRQQIGIVPQDTLLFEGTVQENITLNNPDATEEEMIAAARIAVAHDFIMSLPSGYNTFLSERGASLSGGQRQRIALARTILQNPRLLILDEATSALDYDSERQVCLNLAEAFKGRTVFFITHRLNTIRNADRIVVMDQGIVAEQGTHEELMQLRGRYYCLYQQQASHLE